MVESASASAGVSRKDKCQRAHHQQQHKKGQEALFLSLNCQSVVRACVWCLRVCSNSHYKLRLNMTVENAANAPRERGKKGDNASE